MTRRAEVVVCPSTVSPAAVPAVERPCGECAGPVWVSYAMAPPVDTGEVKPWCFACALASGADLVAVQHPRQAALGQSSGEFSAMAARVIDAIRTGRR